MKALNQIIITILLANQAKLADLESLTKMCSPARYFILDSIETEVKIADSIFDAMHPLATGRNKAVLDAFGNLIDARYTQIYKNITKYRNQPKCPHNSLKGCLFFIREGIEYNLGEHQKMQKIFK
jgi:hypothetical protein